MNISGEYNTTSKEISIVKLFLDINKIEYKSINKYKESDAGDVIVKFNNNLELLFEIKEENSDRIKKYGQYGIDYISSCVFKDKESINYWRGAHSSKEFKDFLSSIDYKNVGFKWGKIKYSRADVWLFFAKDYTTNSLIFINAYSARKIKESDLLTYLQENCQFAVNNKSIDQLSNSDTHHSATFFIDIEKMDVFKMTNRDWKIYIK